MQIMPAPLEENSTSLRYQLDRLIAYFSKFQIDIADGKLVKNRTVSMEEVISLVSNYEIIIDLHLMVEDYKSQLKLINSSPQQSKVNRVFIHAKANPSPLLFEQGLPYQLGLVINPEENVEIIGQRYNLHKIPNIQIMTVNPGLQGQAFMPETINKIDQLRRLGYKDTIVIDGGINADTLPYVLTAPSLPDIIAVGSYFTKVPDEILPQNIEKLRKIINNATLA